MTISSRTLEGRPSHCPVCGSDVCVEPSILIGDATCPNCGSLLWFLNVPPTSLVFERDASPGMRDRVLAIVSEQLGVDPEKITEGVIFLDDLDADSLDIVELFMQLEEEFDTR